MVATVSDGCSHTRGERGILILDWGRGREEIVDHLLGGGGSVDLEWVGKGGIDGLR